MSTKQCAFYKSMKEKALRCPHNAKDGVYCGIHKNASKKSGFIQIPIYNNQKERLEMDWTIPNDAKFWHISPNKILVPEKGQIAIVLQTSPYAETKNDKN